MEEKKEAQTWEEYIEVNPSEFETLKNSKIYQALLTSVFLEYNRIKETITRAKVETEVDVRRFNHDQGSLEAFETLYLKLIKPIPDEDLENLNEGHEEEDPVFRP